MVALRTQGLAVTAQKMLRTAKALGADACWRVAKDKQCVDYVVEVKRTVTPATLGAIHTQLQQLAVAGDRPVLLVTTHVTPQTADRLRALGQQFVDAAGNAYLDGPGFLVTITGRKPAEKITIPRPDRAFTVAGLKVMFALICDQELAGAPQRTIAAAAGVALGAVPPVLAAMQEETYLLVAGNQRRLRGTRRLLDDWAQAYARTLRPKALQGLYTTPNFDAWVKWKLDPGQARWGGEPAANLLVGYLKPGVLTIYAERLPPRLMVEQRMQKTSVHGTMQTVELRKPFWGAALQYGGRPDIVPTALVYADLLATGDARCIETARMVYDAELARLFPTA